MPHINTLSLDINYKTYMTGLLVIMLCFFTACVTTGPDGTNATSGTGASTGQAGTGQANTNAALSLPPLDKDGQYIAVDKGKAVFGWIERVRVGDLDFEPKAKLDSGATTSSIHAQIIREFTENGRDFVVFRVDFGEKNNAGNTGPHVFEAPITRWVKIKKKGGKDQLIRRPVVEMTFCLGGLKITEEVNLADRSDFTYPLLIGRNMLEKNALIDTSKTFINPPSCND